jgi:hypothetical protein
MKLLGIIISFLAILPSCTQQKSAEAIIIEGNLPTLPDGKVYLASAFHVPNSIDSTESKEWALYISNQS